MLYKVQGVRYNVYMLKQKTVYFREEDLPLWEAIENKAQWLHDALAGKPARGPIGKSESISPSTHPSPSYARIIKTKQDAIKAVENTGFISKSFSARKRK